MTRCERRNEEVRVREERRVRSLDNVADRPRDPALAIQGQQAGKVSSEAYKRCIRMLLLFHIAACCSGGGHAVERELE